MSETKIKICGLKRPEDIAYVNEYKPDYIGFVFFPPSSRYVSLEKAILLREKLDSKIIPVGVFLDNPIDEVLEVAKSGAVDMIQLHGKTAPELVNIIKEEKLTDLPVMEAISVTKEADIEYAMTSKADFILLDNGPGGTGETFNWELLNKVERPYFLAGGLNADNVCDALKLHPYGVDTSSGVETEKIKDADKIRKFIAAVRNKEEA